VTKKKRSASRHEEWVVGKYVLPLSLGDDGVVPELLVWIGEDGALLGLSSAPAGTLLERVLESFEETVRSPLVGAPRRPSRVRTQSLELAEVLRRAGVNVEVDATPEVDETIDTMLDAFVAESVRLKTSYLATGGVKAEQVAAFFDAAAKLTRSDPWEILQDGDKVAVTIESLDARELVVVFSRSAGMRGLMVYDGEEEHDALVNADELLGAPNRESLGGYWALLWLRGAALSDELRREVMRNGWTVAAPDAYPWLNRVDRGVRDAPLTARDFAVLEAVMRAVDALLSEVSDEAIEAAFCKPGATIERTVSVGGAAVSVRVPFAAIEPQDWLREWREGEASENRVQIELTNGEVLMEFIDSPEGEIVPDSSCVLWLMGFLVNQKPPRTLASLDAVELFEIVVTAMPKELEVLPEAAPLVIEELRAFFQFLSLRVDLPGADDFLAALGPAAEQGLADALAKRVKGKRRPRASSAKRAKKRTRR
jgi:hypothetical protein